MKPSSTIHLCKVPFDSSNKHQVYFGSDRTAQFNYFYSKRVSGGTLVNYVHVRETLPDGGLVSKIQVGINIDDLREKGVNYMIYQNPQHGDRWYYAFITKIIYINEGVTALQYETDVYQTWMADCTVLPSYVVREHSSTDVAGENVVPEKFNFQEYTYKQAYNDTTLDKHGYMVICNEGPEGQVWGVEYSGIFQGLYHWFTTSAKDVLDLLYSYNEEGKEAVESISVIPAWAFEGLPEGEGYISGSKNPVVKNISISFNPDYELFGTYLPKNNKLYTFPYYALCVTNHNGEVAEYKVEDFKNNKDTNGVKQLVFQMSCDISTNPTVCLMPLDYQNIAGNYDEGICISSFPQCSFASDTYKLWLAKNQFTQPLKIMGNAVQAIGIGMATGGPVGVGIAIASGASGIIDTINDHHQAQLAPNKIQSGSAKNNLLTAMDLNKFHFYWRQIKPEFARTIDDFFTMYGYQTNRIKTPNMHSRPYFNYVQTIDIHITGGIPSDDMQRLKSIFNTGVTLWKPAAVIGDYTQDNRAVSPVNVVEE